MSHEFTESQVEKFFNQGNITIEEVNRKFGQPEYKIQNREGHTELKFVFANFYKPKPSEGEFCGITVYFDSKGKYIRYSPLY